MTGRRIARIVGLLGVAAMLAAATSLAQDPDERERRGSRTAFMRQKLEFSKNLLEGLTTENFELIEKNARALKRLSTAAQWEVPTIPVAEEYLPQTTEFQRECDEAAKAAANKNIDAATVAYLRMTTTCVSCHKYVRSVIK
jgi:cytochrome c556